MLDEEINATNSSCFTQNISSWKLQFRKDRFHMTTLPLPSKEISTIGLSASGEWQLPQPVAVSGLGWRNCCGLVLYSPDRATVHYGKPGRHYPHVL